MRPPDRLSESARAAWEEIAAGLPPERQVGVEGPALEAYAVQVARMRDAQARIDTEGLIVPDEKGRPVEHPALRVERAAQDEVRAWASTQRSAPRRRRGSSAL